MRWLQALAALLVYVWIAGALLMVAVYCSHPAVGKSREYRMTQRISAAGLEHIKHFEGLKLKSYYCTSGVCTIGWGHTGPEVKPGMVITEEQAEQFLLRDLAAAEKAVSELVKVPLRQGQWDCLVDFAFNLGRVALAKSTLLKKLNARDYSGASEELMRWVHSGGQIIAGLQRRRLAARAMWEGRS